MPRYINASFLVTCFGIVLVIALVTLFWWVILLSLVGWFIWGFSRYLRQ